MSKKNRDSAFPGSETAAKTKSAQSDKQTEAARRSFLKISVASGVGVCAVGTPICAAVRLVTAPVFAESVAGKFYPLATLATLTEKPQKFAIVDDKRDAWTTLPKQNIGTVFLRKNGEQVSAFHSLCPHAGCMIQVGRKKNPQTGNEEELFYCPCHAAHFGLDGKRLDGVSPRDLDSLEVQVSEDGRVAVKFENFTFGIADKKSGK